MRSPEDIMRVVLWITLLGWTALVVGTTVTRPLEGGECLWSLAGKHHAEQGVAVTKGGTIQSWTISPPRFYLTHPPLQGWYLGLWYWIFGWNVFITRIAILSLWFAACAGMAWTVKDFTRSTNASLAAALLFLSVPATWMFGVTNDLTSLNASLMTLGFATYVYWEKQNEQTIRFWLMVVVFSLAALADWPGFTCLPVLFGVALVLRRPKNITRPLLFAAVWMFILFGIVAYYLDWLDPGKNSLLAAFSQRSGEGESLIGAASYWTARSVMYFLPTSLILFAIGLLVTARTVVARGLSKISGSELAMVSFFLANAIVFVLLKEWSGGIAQTIVYWTPVVSFWSGYAVLRKNDVADNTAWKTPKSIIVLLAGHIMLAGLAIVVLSEKRESANHDVEIGAWLSSHLLDGKPLAVTVNRRDAQANPAHLSYWTRREVSMVLANELESIQDGYIFVPESLASKMRFEPNIKVVAIHLTTRSERTGIASMSMRFYSMIFPEKEKYFTFVCPYEEWSLLERFGNSLYH